MSLTVFGSQKGSPGATLTALAVAGAWAGREGRRIVLLEADPDGGVLAVRYGLGREPGLLSLAASARHGVTRGDLWSHTQQIPGGLAVIVGPDRPDRATAAVNIAGATLGSWLAELPDVDVIADVGRLSPSSPALAFAAAADLVLMVARPTAEQIMPAAERVNTLRAHNESAAWCLIGSKPHTPTEIEEVHHTPVLGVIADDPRGAAALEGGGNPKRIARSALARSAGELARLIDAWHHEPPSSNHSEVDDEPVDDTPTPDPANNNHTSQQHPQTTEPEPVRWSNFAQVSGPLPAPIAP